MGVDSSWPDNENDVTEFPVVVVVLHLFESSFGVVDGPVELVVSVVIHPAGEAAIVVVAIVVHTVR